MTQPSEDVVAYLQENFRRTIEDDFGLIIRSEKGGFFAIPRLTFSAVDYLACFYLGNPGSRRFVKKRNQIKFKGYELAKSKNAERFLSDVLGEIDSGYRNNAFYLYDMLRHATVHSYAPRRYSDPKGKTHLGCLLYRGDRTDTVELKELAERYIWVTHLRIQKVRLRDGSETHVLPVSMNCLFWDLLKAAVKLAEILKKDASRRQSAQKVYEMLESPTHVNPIWWDQ